GFHTLGAKTQQYGSAPESQNDGAPTASSDRTEVARTYPTCPGHALLPPLDRLGHSIRRLHVTPFDLASEYDEYVSQPPEAVHVRRPCGQPVRQILAPRQLDHGPVK